MVRTVLRIISVIMLSAFVCINAHAAWRIVFDRNCLKIVMANTASQKLIEEQHNQRVDTIAAKKQKVELYKLSMENISGFGTESLYYKEIGLCALDILRNVPVLVSTVNRAKFSNKLLCLNELGNLVAETQQLVGNFVNIVNNAKIPNPLQGQATAEKKDDGYNLLDRYERLTLANSIYTDLNRIRYKVEGMVLMAQYATANDLFFAIDPEGWANVVTMKNHVGNLVQDWNGLVASNYKLRNISIISVGIIMLLMPVKASAFIIPKDLPTIEALIALHKAVKKDEDKALTRVATSYGEQSLIEKGAEKFNDVRTTLDTRLNNAYSYLVLAGAISSTANSLYQLVTEYKDFTGNTFSHVSKKPFVAWYYADANVAISREIQHCYRLYASVAASGINLMKASMDEKLNLVMTLKASIDRARYIIDNANLYCFLVTDCGWKPDYIWEILNSNVKNEIAERVINKWNQGYAG